MNNLPYLFDIKRILNQLQDGTLLLTPNHRLRSKILQAWAGHQKSQGMRVWQTPRVEVISQWFNQQWLQLQSQGYQPSTQVISSSDQQRVIWEAITSHCGLMQTEAIAQQAANAYNTLQQWNLSLSDIQTQYPLNEPLPQWIQAFEQRLKTHNSISVETSYRIIGDAFESKLLVKEDRIALLGFDDLTPLLNQQLEKASHSIIHIPPAHHQPNSLKRVSYENSSAEITAAAQWARHILTDKPNSRIGIISPNLGQCRQHIERIFSEEFEAYNLHPATEAYTLPFNFSAGTPLGNSPLISDTIKILKINKKQWLMDDIECVLLSQFWGKHAIELSQRCALISQLQSLNTLTISDNTLRYWAQKNDERRPSTEHGLFNYLHQCHQFSQHSMNRGQQLPSRWVEIFLHQLDILQWPGERIPNSQEYQQTQLWYQVLESFTHLDDVLGAINEHDALKQIQHMVSHTPFQAKVPDSPIQILGILEGAGLHFTHCWVMGLHQTAWPPAPSPNSLLPIRLQRDYNMPHASSLRELQYAESLTNNYRHCADSIIFSSPNHEDDSEQTLLASQLIADIPLSTLPTQTSNDSLSYWMQTLQDSQTLEAIDCRNAPPYAKQQLPGGSGVFKAQSANPFDCFIHYRLRSPLPIEAVNGFSHIDKGHILHNSLAALWQQLKTQEQLLDLEEDALNQLIQHTTDEAIRDIQRHKPAHLSDTLCQIESERQCQLIKQWLKYEKQRSPFTVVATEEAHTIQFNGIDINIRIDRVDQLSDGRYLIIDYKTGTATVNAWNGERPQEPQLPLYALTYGEDIRGISFAQININDQHFKGLAANDIAQGISHIERNRAGLPDTWEDALNHWQRVLNQLLTEFQQGYCAIEYLNDTTKTYAREYLRINRFYEADAINNYLNQSPTRANTPSQR